MTTGIATKCSPNNLGGAVPGGAGASVDPRVQRFLDNNCTAIALKSECFSAAVGDYHKDEQAFIALLQEIPSAGPFSSAGGAGKSWGSDEIWGVSAGNVTPADNAAGRGRIDYKDLIGFSNRSKALRLDSIELKSGGPSGSPAVAADTPLSAIPDWADPAYSARINSIIQGKVSYNTTLGGGRSYSSNLISPGTPGFDPSIDPGDAGYMPTRHGPLGSNILSNIERARRTVRGLSMSLHQIPLATGQPVTPNAVVDAFIAKAEALLDSMKTKMNGDLGPAGCAGKLANMLALYGKELGTAAGIAITRGPGTGAQRGAAAGGLLGAAGAGLAGITVEVSRDIRYKEQCILLSQIAPLSQYRRNIDMVYGRRLPYSTSPTEYWSGAQHPLDANAPLLVDGESFGFMNRLTQYGNMRQFFDMTNAEIAGLQPLIRLFKVIDANSPSAKSSEQEIYFDSYATDKDVKDIFKNKNKRGFGVGIKSFNVVFDGQDMFAQKKSIKATLKLHANSFEELLRPRTLRGRTFRYIDLALKTGKTVIEKRPELDELNFRLKAVFGWVPIKGTNNVLSPEVRNALNGTFVSVNLTPVTHNFDFDDMGRVTFTIEYFAYVDEFYDKPRMNIFTHHETYSKILMRKIAFESAEQDASCDTDQGKIKEIAALKKSEADKIEKEKVSMLNHLLKKMFSNDDIYFLNLSREQLKAIIAQGPHYEFATGLQVNRPGQPLDASLQGDIAATWKRAITAAPRGTGRKEDADLEASLLAAGIDSQQIPFFYVGDLLDLIIGNMEKFLNDTLSSVASANSYLDIEFNEEIKKAEENALKKSIKEYKKLRIMLGPLEIVNHGTGDQIYINFADVPVSVAYVSEWLTSKLLKKDQAIYPLVQFMKDLFNDLLKQFLNNDTCYPFSIKQKVRLFQSVVTSYPNSKQQPDEISALAKNLPGNRLDIFKAHEDYKNQPFLQISGKSDFNNPNPGIEKEMNYFVFYAGRTQPMNLMNGTRRQDEDRGIFHYLLGKDRGIVKNIQLNKTNTPGLKEVRFEQEGFDGLRQLREIYDVDVDTYANIRAFPGNYIFVDPKGFDPSLQGFSRDGFDLTDLGVGGYFMVIRSEHQFEAGVADTKLTAVWVASALGANSAIREQNIIEQNSGANAGVKAKCASKRSKDAKTRMKQSVEDETIVGGYGGGTRVEYPS